MTAQQISRWLRSAVDVVLRPGPAPVGAAGQGRPCPPGPWFQEAGHRIHSRGVFVGCPLELFEVTARDPLLLALIEGLHRDSAVLEVGCGCLRVGYWFIDYLNPGRYHGIEPNERMLDTGREVLLGDRAPDKRPSFRHNDDFDFGVFGTPFDFVIAFSIWSHASKEQIGRMLDSFQRTARPGGKFLASWFRPCPGMPDYEGSSWVGRSHQSDEPGVVAHDPAWLVTAAAARGLRCAFHDGFITLGQSWAVVTRP